MSADELHIRGLTGVDLTRQVAGPGTRAYAFLIDWHIRVLVALAWVLVGLLVIPWGSGLAFRSGFLLPAALVYLLYHPVLEVLMHGRTPGKRIAGARLVMQDGSTPGMGPLLMRNVFRLVDQLPGLYVLGLLCCLFTPQRVRIGDLAAGTVLVLEEPARSLAGLGSLLSRSRLSPDAAALVRSVLDRWPELEPQAARSLARDLLTRLDAREDGAAVDSLDAGALRARLESLLA